MTAYFSLPLEEIDKLYSLKTYWVCFVVVGVLTMLLLLFFNLANSKVTGKIAYQSLTKIFVQRVRRKSISDRSGHEDERKEVLV